MEARSANGPHMSPKIMLGVECGIARFILGDFSARSQQWPVCHSKPRTTPDFKTDVRMYKISYTRALVLRGWENETPLRLSMCCTYHLNNILIFNSTRYTTLRSSIIIHPANWPNPSKSPISHTALNRLNTRWPRPCKSRNDPPSWRRNWNFWMGIKLVCPSPPRQSHLHSTKSNPLW